eukprot:c6671_g1_i2.p1 GENE.c6671_g1_i2~~c6671_g1_i2.p1  ORF type:complete len:255 (+),score=38.00 c6671_g1_i2:47-766(+)
MGVSVNSLTHPQLSGWLQKQGHVFKNWKRRFFVLQGCCLWYFKDEKQDAVGVSVLDSATIRVVSLAGITNCVQISHANRPSLFISFPDAWEMGDWLQTLFLSTKLTCETKLANAAGEMVPNWKPKQQSDDWTAVLSRCPQQGWLELRHFFLRHCQRWWVVLYNGTLYLLSNERNLEPVGAICLSEYNPTVDENAPCELILQSSNVSSSDASVFDPALVSIKLLANNPSTAAQWLQAVKN